MTIKLIITIDTEEDLWGTYKVKDNPVENISGIPRLQEIFNRYGVIPTYLINYPVAINSKAMAILLRILDAGQCEIATHCHPWNTPPFEKKSNPETMLFNLDSDLIQNKLETLHKLISSEIGMPPSCFRAGRWGFGERVSKSLLKLGYLIDTSVTPYTNWQHKKGPDFSKAPTQPYWIDEDNVLTPSSDGGLLELPVTVGFYQKNMAFCGFIRRFLMKGFFRHTHILGGLDKMNLLNYRWLSPEICSGSEMIQLSKNFVQSEHQFLNMYFHSNSLLPGKNPFVKNERELEAFFDDIEIFLKFAMNENMSFIALRDVLKFVKKQ